MDPNSHRIQPPDSSTNPRSFAIAHILNKGLDACSNRLEAEFKDRTQKLENGIEQKFTSKMQVYADMEKTLGRKIVGACADSALCVQKTHTLESQVDALFISVGNLSAGMEKERKTFELAKKEKWNKAYKDIQLNIEISIGKDIESLRNEVEQSHRYIRAHLDSSGANNVRLDVFQSRLDRLTHLFEAVGQKGQITEDILAGVSETSSMYNSAIRTVEKKVEDLDGAVAEKTRLMDECMKTLTTTYDSRLNAVEKTYVDEFTNIPTAIEKFVDNNLNSFMETLSTVYDARLTAVEQALQHLMDDISNEIIEKDINRSYKSYDFRLLAVEEAIASGMDPQSATQVPDIEFDSAFDRSDRISKVYLRLTWLEDAVLRGMDLGSATGGPDFLSDSECDLGFVNVN
jgi:hypothetical protein